MIVPSFLQNQWVTPDNPAKTTAVKDSTTGETIAEVSADGLDIAGAVNYAREVSRKT